MYCIVNTVQNILGITVKYTGTFLEKRVQYNEHLAMKYKVKIYFIKKIENRKKSFLTAYFLFVLL